MHLNTFQLNMNIYLTVYNNFKKLATKVLNNLNLQNFSSYLSGAFNQRYSM